MKNLTFKFKRKLKYYQPHAGQESQLKREAQSQQLELFPQSEQQQKRQIVSTPGVSPKQRNRYRVMLGDVVLGDRLTINQAIELAKLNCKRSSVAGGE